MSLQWRAFWYYSPIDLRDIGPSVLKCVLENRGMKVKIPWWKVPYIPAAIPFWCENYTIIRFAQLIRKYDLSSQKTI